MQWGIDLGQLTGDREARNESSYRPDGIPTTWGASTAPVIKLIRCIWEMLEPSPSAPFSVIDRYILRLAVEGYFKGTTGKQPSPNNADFVTLVNQTVASASLAPLTAERLAKFLFRQEAGTDPILFDYAQRKPVRSSNDVFGVISRAVLLLRMATGSANILLKNVGFGSDLLSFWWEEIGAIRGLWPVGDSPSLLADLWADIEMCLDDLSSIENMEPGMLRSTNEHSLGLVGRLNVLASHERVGLWGLCSA